MVKGIKLNNPGNLEKCYYIFVGEKTVSEDEKYKQFYELVYGVRAIFKQIQVCITVGHNDIRSIINLWSATSKERAEDYKRFVCEKTQMSPEKKLDFKEADVIKKLGAAIYEYETGEKPNFEDIEQGYELVMGNKIL